jgi:hypothetical protein
MSKEMAKGGGVKQTRPQETDSTYSKAIDKQVAGKPVGWRFTDKLAKKLGKKAGTKPTAQEIEKYKNKGVYFETRKNKSDLNPKAKLDHGGDSSEILSDGSKLDNFTAVGIAEGFVENDNAHDQIKAWAYIQRHGMCRNLQGWFGRTCAAMIDRGIFDREGNIDYEVVDDLMIGGDDYAKGGKTKKVTTPEEYHEKKERAFQNALKNLDSFDFEMFSEEGNDAVRKEVQKAFDKIDNLEKKPSKDWALRLKRQIIYNVADNFTEVNDTEPGTNISVLLDYKLQQKGYDFGDDYWDYLYYKYAKGGQTAPQRESYSKRGDKEVKAKPAGYRFTEKLANRLGKNVYAKPTPEQVSKYSGKGVYFENRKDKSDVKPNEYLAMGGVSQHGLRKGDKIVEVQGEYAGVDNKNQHFAVDISRGERRRITNNSIGPVLKNPSKKYGGDVEYAKGGQTAAQRESYSKRGDREVKAKPVGYRFTDALAKRLGKSATTKPTAEQIRKYLGKGIYFENRKDKSDIKPNEYLAKGGGIKQTRPQETDSTYSKSIDKQVSGKPVGYRFTDKLAKRLGKNPLTAPKISEIEKYKGKGVYFETRKNKSDINPKGKLAYGGVNDVNIEFARGGGVPRTSNADSKAFTENHLPFVANNLEGKTLENGDYVVLSYGYYPIWFWHKRTNKWYGNKDKFSVTTAKHISQSRPTYEAEMLSRGEMDNLMSKSIEGKDFKEMGGTLDSFVVAQQ